MTVIRVLDWIQTAGVQLILCIFSIECRNESHNDYEGANVLGNEREAICETHREALNEISFSSHGREFRPDWYSSLQRNSRAQQRDRFVRRKLVFTGSGGQRRFVDDQLHEGARFSTYRALSRDVEIQGSRSCRRCCFVSGNCLFADSFRSLEIKKNHCS